MPKVNLASLIEGLGRGIGSISESHSQVSQMKMAQQREQQQRALLNKLATASPLEKAKIWSEIDPRLGLEYEKQQMKMQQQSQLQDLLSQISQRSQGAGPGITPQAIQPNIPGISPVKQPIAPTQTFSEAQAQDSIPVQQADILQAAALNPAVSRALGDISKAQQREKQFEYGKEQDIRKETQKYVDNVLDKFQGAKTSEAILGQMDKLASEGGLTSPLMYNLLGKLGLPLGVLNNPNAEEFEKDTNFLTRDIQKFYGARILASEFQNFLKQLPSLSNSEEGRKRIIKNLQKVLLPATFEYKAYKEILKENGGKRPPNLREQVMERMEPLLDKWGAELKADIRKIDPAKVPEGTLIIIAPDGRRVAVPKEHVAGALAQGGQLE